MKINEDESEIVVLKGASQKEEFGTRLIDACLRLNSRKAIANDVLIRLFFRGFRDVSHS